MASQFPTGPGLGGRPALQHYLKSIEAALGAGDTERAIRMSAEAAQRGIEHPGMLALAVYRFLDIGQPQQALRYATRARALAPRQSDVLNAFGQTLVKLGRHGEALQAYDEALKYTPSSFVSHFNKANALLDMSWLQLARDHFIAALAQSRACPNHDPAGKSCSATRR